MTPGAAAGGLHPTDPRGRAAASQTGAPGPRALPVATQPQAAEPVAARSPVAGPPVAAQPPAAVVTTPAARPLATPELRRALRLSILIPVYNERATIAELLRRVHAVALDLEKEVVVVDDCSSDGTGDEVERFRADHPDLPLHLVRHERNRGKGAGVRTALERATGDFVVIQDGDLEYDPRDYPVLLGPLLDGRADAVFGSRFLGGPHRVLYFWHSIGNKALTLLSNVFTNYNLTDMEVCYKAMHRHVALSLSLTSERFGIEPEITAKLARGGFRLYEVPVSYAGRSYEEGKKIGWRDGVAALGHIIRFRFL